jgi:predicted GIY-YIG superfamily endonuclease
MLWVYVLEFDDHTFYIGVTIDVESRMHQHELRYGKATLRELRAVIGTSWGRFESAGAKILEAQLHQEYRMRYGYDKVRSRASVALW